LFFDAAAEAERAGYRACRRCRPDSASTDPWIEKIRRACMYLANVDGHPSLAAIARLVGGSPYHLQRHFKQIVGITPREYAEARRFDRVRRGLRKGARVTTAMADAGYGSSSRFYERAAPKLGMPPMTYRQGGAGVIVRYTIVDSPLGRLLVAATARGVCFVGMDASDDKLVAELRREFPSALVEQDRRSLEPWVHALLAHLDGRTPRLDLPLDVQATAFQWQVWRALAQIPYGVTRSYAQLARAIGHPRAARAVGRACATNPVSIAIPCHRALTSNGAISGYRWGVSRKKALLALEQRGRPKG
jgi:AraC family transcriptional regulator of adaptative response/methylated-DNA-[protein]-cysteine methyltransferase